MKIFYTLLFLVLLPALSQAQFKPAYNANITLNQNSRMGIQRSTDAINRYSDLVSATVRTSSADTILASAPDTMKYNMYGDLLDDNPLYNPKSSLGMIALRVTLANTSTFLIDRYIFNYEFSFDHSWQS